MKLLPKWLLTNGLPAFYDHESGTAVEQTYKIYNAMNELINDYNKFVDETNNKIIEFMNDANADQEVFCTSLRQEFQDFIDCVELKLQNQDKIIQDFINQEVDQIIIDTLNQTFNELEESLNSRLDKMEQDLYSGDIQANSVQINTLNVNNIESIDGSEININQKLSLSGNLLIKDCDIDGVNRVNASFVDSTEIRTTYITSQIDYKLIEVGFEDISVRLNGLINFYLDYESQNFLGAIGNSISEEGLEILGNEYVKIINANTDGTIAVFNENTTTIRPQKLILECEDVEITGNLNYYDSNDKLCNVSDLKDKVDVIETNVNTLVEKQKSYSDIDKILSPGQYTIEKITSDSTSISTTFGMLQVNKVQSSVNFANCTITQYFYENGTIKTRSLTINGTNIGSDFSGIAWSDVE